MNKANVPVSILLLLILCFGIGLVAKGQANFRPGYVVSLAGDTLRGEVDSREGGTNAERCRFRAIPTADIITYSPTEVRGFGIAGGRRYRTLTMPVSDARIRVGAVAGLPYFMEVLVDGPAQLYFMRVQGYDHFLVASPVRPLALLQHGIERVDRKMGSDVVTYQEELTPYRQVLAQALPNCPLAQRRLPALAYTEFGFRRVVVLYNDCQGSPAMPLAKRAVAAHVRLGLMGGMSRSRQLFDANSPYHGQAILDNATPTAGITLALTVPRISQERFTLQTALLYGVDKSDREYTAPAPGTLNGVQGLRLHFNVAFLRVPVMIRYTYPRGRVRPLLEGGFVSTIAIRSENYHQTTDYFGEFTSPQMDKDFGVIGYGAGVGAGLATLLPGGRALSLLARADINYGFLTSTPVQRFSALLSVDLTK